MNQIKPGDKAKDNKGHVGKVISFSITNNDTAYIEWHKGYKQWVKTCDLTKV